MAGDQVINLSEPVSEQTHGIVLAWCWYEDGEAANYDWVYNFVPKSHIDTHITSIGTYCYGFGVEGHMAKYIYVKDNTVSGYSKNTGNQTVGGITFSNSNFVLRYVIGI